MRKILSLEWLYPSHLSEQDRLNRLFLTAIILLTVSVLVMGTWMNFWEVEKKERREATDKRNQVWEEGYEKWQREMSDYLKRRSP